VAGLHHLCSFSSTPLVSHGLPHPLDRALSSPPLPPTRQLSEAVIGYAIRDNALLLKKLFATRYFRVTLLNDVVRRRGDG
jgi:hypothetical protein